MNLLDRIYVKNYLFVTRVIAEILIIVPIARIKKEPNCLFTLNEVAADIWRMIDGKRKISGILDELVGIYETSADQIKIDLEIFIAEMEKNEVIVLKEVKNEL